MARPTPHVRIPKYCLHKARDIAYVRLDGVVKYLPGPYGSAASRAEYNRLVGLWQLNGRRLPAETFTPPQAMPLVVPAGTLPPVTCFKVVDELIKEFLIECERDYPPRDGKRSSELACIERSMISLSRLYGQTPVNQMKPVYLERVMQDYVASGYCRKMVNRNLSYCKRAFKWGVKNDWVSGETYYKLTTVSGLRKGRSTAQDSPPVRPVDEAIVEATVPHLSEEVAAMARLQLLTGNMHEQRKTPLSCGNVPGSNRKAKPQRLPGDRYDSNAYGKAIHRACGKAFTLPEALRPDTRRWKDQQKEKYVAEHGQEALDKHHAQIVAWYERHYWHPHQLRHTTSTRVARMFGEIASQNLLGHSSLKTTAIYTERDWDQAARVMAQIG